MPQVTQLLNGKAELELASPWPTGPWAFVRVGTRALCPQSQPLSQGFSLVGDGLVLLSS